MDATVKLIELKKYVDRDPFRPFRICLSDGSEHEIPAPATLFLTKSFVYLMRWDEDDEIPDTKKVFDPVHITRVEMIEGGPTA